MVGIIDCLQHKLLANWMPLHCSASCIVCWWHRSLFFSGLWVLDIQRWYRCLTVLNPWRASRKLWTWCISIHPWRCPRSCYASIVHGCCPRRCEDFFQLLQSFLFALTLWKISTERFFDILQRLHHHICWCHHGISEVFMFIKNYVEDPLCLCFFSTNFESPVTLHGSPCVPAVDAV